MVDIPFFIAGCVPCCNGVANYINVDCRTRGGAANFIGWAETAGLESSPPKFYRNMVISGKSCQVGYGSIGCGGAPLGGSGHDASLSCQYDPVTGVVSNTGSDKVLSDATGSSCLTVTSTGTTCNPSMPATTSQTAFTVTRSSTHWDRTGTAVCTALGAPAFVVATGTYAFDLLDEDLETDAIARLDARSNYTAWALPLAPGCMSNYQSRTSNIFTHQEAQYRANVNLANSTSYSMMAELWRAPFGFANYVLYSYQITPFSTDATGFASVIANVPITKGYSTYVANVETF